MRSKGAAVVKQVSLGEEVMQGTPVSVVGGGATDMLLSRPPEVDPRRLPAVS